MFRSTLRSPATLITTACAAALTVCAAGQTPVLSCKTEVGSYAQVDSKFSGRYITRGTRIPGSAQVKAEWSDAGAAASASTAVAVQQLRASTQIVITERADLDCGRPAKAKASTYNRRQSYLLRDVRPARKYRIDIKCDAAATAGGSYFGEIDVGDDRTPEFTAQAPSSVTRQLTVTTGASGLRVAITSATDVTLTGAGKRSCNARLQIDVTDLGPLPRCAIRSFGVSCGPRLSATEGPTTTSTPVVFRTTSAKPNSSAMLMIGTDDTSVKIPGTSCFILVDPIIHGIPHVIDASGQGSLTVQLPLGVRADAVLQDVVYRTGPNGLELETGNAVGLTCKQ